MKEIKFRILGMDRIGGWSYFKIPDDIAQWDGNANLFYDDEKTLCEYTGLKDIYQNDIVECPDGWRGKVWWNEEELQWWAKDHDLANLNNPKVIGDIYENKESLCLVTKEQK